MLTTVFVLLFLFCSTYRITGEELPKQTFRIDPNACYIIVDSDNKMIDISGKNVYLIEKWNSSAERAWRFIIKSQNTTHTIYTIQKCLKNQFLAWTDQKKDYQCDGKRCYVFDGSQINFKYNEWLIVAENDGKYHQIIDAASGRHNLYIGKFSSRHQLVLVWTGLGVNDWSGNEHLKRLWRFEKIESNKKAPMVFQPDPKACYILKDLNDKIPSLAKTRHAEKEIYILDRLNTSVFTAWKFIAISSNSSNQTRYKIQKCLTDQFLAWTDRDKAKQYGAKRFYLFDEFFKQSLNFSKTEWLILPENDGEYYQIIDAESGRHNLYSGKPSNQQILLVWTGQEINDWNFWIEHIKRLWRIEKLAPTK